MPGKGDDQDDDDVLPGLGGVYNPLNLNLYGYTSNKPTKYTDPDGNFIQMATGFAMGTLTDIGVQYFEAKLKHETFHLDTNQVLISGASGALTGGLSMLEKSAKVGRLAKIAIEAAGVGKDIAASSASQYNKKGKVDLADTISDVALGKVGGSGTKKAAERGLAPKLKIQNMQLNRLERIGKQNPRASRKFQ